jgi:hypothetical protein
MLTTVPPSEAAFALEAEITTKKKPVKRRNRKVNFEAAREEADAMRKTNEWSNAAGRHLVALYAWLHREVYGVDAAELVTGDTYVAAVSAANRMLANEFGGKAERAVEFMRWTWKREARAEKKRREQRDEGGRRITWRLQFAARHLLVDYRVDLVRGRAGR